MQWRNVIHVDNDDPRQWENGGREIRYEILQYLLMTSLFNVEVYEANMLRQLKVRRSRFLSFGHTVYNYSIFAISI